MKTKQIGLLALLMAICSITNAQGLGDWFNQKNEQKKQLLEQIVALKAYIKSNRNGTVIVNNGKKLAGDIRLGDKNLHQQYLDKKYIVSPSIKSYKRVEDIIRLHQGMGKRKTTILNQAKEGGQFTAKELAEMTRIYSSISGEADRDLDELLLVTTNGEASMSDDERINLIEQIYKSMQQKSVHQQRFGANVLALAQARNRKKQDLKVLKGLY